MKLKDSINSKYCTSRKDGINLKDATNFQRCYKFFKGSANWQDSTNPKNAINLEDATKFRFDIKFERW